MVKKTTIVLFLFLISFSLVSSVQLDPEPINKDLEIYQQCNNCTSCNFTRIKYGGENIFNNTPATRNGTYYFFVIGGGNLTTKGTLTYCYECGNSVEKETGCNDIPITYNGKSLTTQTSILYLGLIVFLVFIFVLLLLAYSAIPDDHRDEEGFIINISRLKYLKPIIIGFCWILLTSIMFIASNVAIAYLDTGLLGDFLFWIFRFMMLSNLVVFPLCIIYMIQRITMSKEMMGLIERGVQFT